MNSDAFNFSFFLIVVVFSFSWFLVLRLLFNVNDNGDVNAYNENDPGNEKGDFFFKDNFYN